MRTTPASLGYRMPAEWEPHAATWLSWPRREGISFPEAYDRVMPTFRAMVAALVESEPVCINVCNGAHEAEARAVLEGLAPECITYYEIPTNEPWCRDHGPIFLTRAEEPRLAVVDWNYNAWGGKYPPFDLDEVVPTRVAQSLGVPVYDGGMILEGGAIDVNGRGALLTTESCLLNPNRNPNLTREQIEARMRDFLGVRDIFWLSRGTEGDDTDGHIDNLARFVSERTVLAVVEDDTSSANYDAAPGKPRAADGDPHRRPAIGNRASPYCRPGWNARISRSQRATRISISRTIASSSRNTPTRTTPRPWPQSQNSFPRAVRSGSIAWN